MNNKSLTKESKEKNKTDGSSASLADKRMIWITAKEVAGLGDIPDSERWAREKLKSLANGDKSLCRKRKGTKATEYHVSILPDDVQKMLAITSKSEVSNSRVANEDHVLHDSEGDEDIKVMWNNIFNALPENVILDIIDTIQRKGANSILIPERHRQILAMLQDLPDEYLKEILLLANEAQYCALTGVPFKPVRFTDSNKRKSTG